MRVSFIGSSGYLFLGHFCLGTARVTGGKLSGRREAGVPDPTWCGRLTVHYFLIGAVRSGLNIACK